MRKFKLFFYSLLFAYLATSVYFGLYIEYMFKQFGMFTFLKFLRHWVAVGLLVILLEWIIENIHIFQIRKRNKKLTKEVSDLKAELYDLQKKALQEKEKPEAISKTTASKPEENKTDNDPTKE